MEHLLGCFNYNCCQTPLCSVSLHPKMHDYLYASLMFTYVRNLIID